MNNLAASEQSIKTTIVRDKFIYIVISRGLSCIVKKMIKMSYRYKLDQIERIEKLYSTDKKEKTDWEEKVIAQIINKEFPNGTWEDFLKTIEKTFGWYAPAEMREEYRRKMSCDERKKFTRVAKTNYAC